MVKITLEFMNVEAAIIALGKLSAIGKARRAAQDAAPDAEMASSAAVTPAPAAPVAAPRKPLADRGKPRGPYKNAPAADNTPQTAAPEAEAEAPAAVAPEVVTLSPEPEVAAITGAAIPSAEDAQKALERVFEAQKNGGIEAARQLMSRFGVRRLRELPDDKRAEFIALADDVLAGKATL